MATTILYEVQVTGASGTLDLVIDYDDVAKTVGGTVTGTGNPVLREFNTTSGKGSGKPIALAQFFGQGRQIVFRNISSTDVLPLDSDGVPTKVSILVTWTP